MLRAVLSSREPEVHWEGSSLIYEFRRPVGGRLKLGTEASSTECSLNFALSTVDLSGCAGPLTLIQQSLRHTLLATGGRAKVKELES